MNGIQCKLARVALGWGVRDLAAAANVSTQTISRLERGELLRDATLDAITQVFEVAGITFIEDSSDGFGIIVRKPQPTLADR